MDLNSRSINTSSDTNYSSSLNPIQILFNQLELDLDNSTPTLIFQLVTSTSPSSSSSIIKVAEVEEKEELQPVLIFSIVIFFCMATMLGNALVIISIIRENYLHSPTNYFIASLAVADFLLGTIVMPFEAISELQGKKWIFGEIWCDLWHALDVLLATASILNLCVISLDRYWAISEPFSYPSKMNHKMSAKLIAAVWVCSIVISLPAILWWRAVREPPFPDDACPFTGDTAYLLTSSTISFYIPLVIMLFTYFKIYRAAVRQTRSIKLGSKFYYDKEMEVKLKMRIHRGGLTRSSFAGKVPVTPPTSSTDGQLSALTLSSPDVLQLQRKRNYSESCYVTAANATTDSLLNAVNTAISPVAVRVNLKPVNRGSFIKRKFTKFSKEKKAAKTLAIVLGVFILCWTPFFIINSLAALCPSCKLQEHIVFNLFTWLGWVNSGMNPIIYAAWNRDFRKAFGRILCFSPCCNKIDLHLPALRRK